MASSDFRDVLEQTHTFPGLYTFRFVVPQARFADVQRLFPDTELQTRLSRTGKYISVSARVTVPSADAVIALYAQAATIDGIVSL